MKRQLKKTASSRTMQAGFTLLELVVSVLIFTIVTGAIYALLRVGSSDRFTVNQQAELIQNARMGLDVMGRDSINAGYQFPNNGASLKDGSLTTLGLSTAALDGINDVLTPLLSADSKQTVNGVATDQITFVSADDTFNVDSTTTTQSATVQTINGGQQLVLRDDAASTEDDDDINQCNDGEIYLIVAGNGSAVGYCTQVTTANKRLDFANSDPLGINKPGAGGPIWPLATPASLRRIRWVTYFVDPSGTLMRRTLGDANTLNGNLPAPGVNPGYLDMPIVTNVENFQVDYVLRDGAVRTQPTVAEMALIRQVRLTLAVRSPEADSRSGQPLRATVTSTFNTRNLEYKK